jgi:glycopeptide antibiotics resistance protein
VLRTYLEPIGGGFVYFLVLAGLIWLPYTVWQYRRRGHVGRRRLWAESLFVLYLLCAWALVLMPFPADDAAACLRNSGGNTDPFVWVDESRAYYESGGLRAMLTSPPLVIRVFNVFLLVPLGVFLRRWFRWSFLTTVIAGFALSLAFELTQVTGNWFIYSCPYRSFDVDDLIANTAGAALGWLIAPAMFFLPRRQEADDVRAQSPMSSVPRRLTAMIVDGVVWIMLMVLVVAAVAIIFTGDDPVAANRVIQAGVLVSWVLLQVVLPWAASGSTIGYAAVGIRVQRVDGARPGLLTMVTRFVLIWGLIAYGTWNLVRPASLWPIAAGLAWWVVLAVGARFQPDRATLVDVITRTRLVTGNPVDAPLPHDSVSVNERAGSNA